MHKLKCSTVCLLSAVGVCLPFAMSASAADVTLGWNAATYDGDGTWEVNQFDSSFGNASSARWQSGTTETLINAATNLANVNSYVQTPDYLLTGTGGDSWHDILGDAASKLDATWEFVFRPGTFSGTRSIFDTGGSGSGVNLRMIGNDVNIRVQTNSTNFLELSTDLSAIGGASDFYHVVAVADVLNPTSISALYVNGQLVNGPGANTSGITDWDGSDGAGLGKIAGTAPGGAAFTDTFAGDIAIVRQYSNQLLSQAQITNNYNGVSGAGPVVTFGWDAADYNSDGTWETSLSDVTLTGANDIVFHNGTGTKVTGATTNFEDITAYITAPKFTQGQNPTPGAANQSFQSVYGDPFTKEDLTLEAVFRPGDFTGRHVIFETGGNGQGLILQIDGSTLTFLPQNTTANQLVLSTDLDAIGDATDFFHVIGVIDTDNPNALSALYVNGVLIGSQGSSTIVADWSGTDAGTIGADLNSTAGGDTNNYTDFTGDLARLNFYHGQALDQADVDGLYGAVPEPSSLALLGLGGLLLARRRRRA